MAHPGRQRQIMGLLSACLLFAYLVLQYSAHPRHPKRADAQLFAPDHAAEEILKELKGIRSDLDLLMKGAKIQQGQPGARPGSPPEGTGDSPPTAQGASTVPPSLPQPTPPTPPMGGQDSALASGEGDSAAGLVDIPGDFQQSYKIRDWIAAKGRATKHEFLSKLKVEKFWALQNSPKSDSQTKAVDWLKNGMVAKPKSQQEPVWKGTFGTTKKRFFEGYKFPSPHHCPGSPYECSGRGVCERDLMNRLTGRCICRPPATGWACGATMTNSFGGDVAALKKAVQTANVQRKAQGKRVLAVAHDGENARGWCTDQKITDKHKQKWDTRASEMCTKGKNGMWKGLNTTVTRAAALSFASVMGFSDGDSLFSIGSGCGHLLAVVKEEWPDAYVSGVDYSNGGVEFSRTLIPDGTFCRADARNIDFVPTESYDFTWTHGVLWYIPKKKQCQVIRSMLRITKPGGTTLVADVKDHNHPIACRMGKSEEGGGHVTVAELERCVEGMGLKIDYLNMKEASGGLYDTYCSAELSLALLHRVI